MDHNDSLRKFEHLMIKEAALAEPQVKASHKQAKEFRELAQKVKES
jgi:hypothetical protein